MYNGILLSHKKGQNNAICRNMDATRDSHTKWSKSDREGQIPYDITYVWNLKYGTNDPIYKTEIDHRHGEQTCGCQGEQIDWKFGLADVNYYRMDKQQSPTV